MTENQGPRVFICYAKEDAGKIDEVYRCLVDIGSDPWIDQHNLVLGDDWEHEIKTAVAKADAFVVCLRPGFDEIGFRQREVRWAIEALQLRPPGRSFIIPFILEPCELPSWCKSLHAGSDLSRPTTKEELASAIAKHSGGVGIRTRRSSTRDSWVLLDKKIRIALQRQIPGIYHSDRPITPFDCASVTELNFSGTQFDDVSAELLARVDTNLLSLHDLNLMRTAITDNAIKTLSSPNSGLRMLSKLYLRTTHVTDVGAQALASRDSTMRTLTCLDLSTTKVGDIGMAAVSGKDSCLGGLTELLISDTLITDVGLSHMCSETTALSALRELSMDGTKIGDNGLAALAGSHTGLKKLEELNLGSTQISNSGLINLARKDTGLRMLKYLNVWYTSVTDEGVLALASEHMGLNNLEHLWLTGTNVSAEAIAAVQRRLPNVCIFLPWHR